MKVKEVIGKKRATEKVVKQLTLVLEYFVTTQLLLGGPCMP